METKALYEKPKIELILLSKNDIIATSGNDIDVDMGENDGEWL